MRAGGRLRDLAPDRFLDGYARSAIFPPRYVYKICPAPVAVDLRRDGACFEDFNLTLGKRLYKNLEALEVGELVRSIFKIKGSLQHVGVVGSASKSDDGCDVSKDGLACFVFHLAEVLVGQREREAELSGFG